jgi:GDP-L-fucose synthase
MVGSAVVHALLDSDPDVLVRGTYLKNDQLLTSHPRLQYVRADLSNQEDCLRVCAGCGLAVMAAAHTGGASELTREPRRLVNENLFINANMLQALCGAGVPRAVIIGSSTLYQASDQPVAEEDLDLNQDPSPPHYSIGWVTRFVEKLARFWHDTAGIELLLVRAANVFGPRAQFDPQKSNFIPALIRKAVDRNHPFEVWGSPDVVRDVIYSEDFADAIVRILRLKEASFEIFNVGSGRPVTVQGVVRAILESADYGDAEVVYAAKGPTSIRARILDCGKLSQATYWKPAHSLEQGIAKTVNWWRNNKEVWSR